MKQADRVKRSSDGLRIYVMAFTAAGLKTAERLSGIFSQNVRKHWRVSWQKCAAVSASS